MQAMQILRAGKFKSINRSWKDSNQTFEILLPGSNDVAKRQLH
jgi:hypothetical protein